MCHLIYVSCLTKALYFTHLSTYARGYTHSQAHMLVGMAVQVFPGLGCLLH